MNGDGGSAYDPDKPGSFEALDLTDPAQVDSYLNHPTAAALADDLARAFSTEPWRDKRRAWQARRRKAVEQWQQAVDALALAATDETRTGLTALVAAMDDEVVRLDRALAALPPS